jgi:FkbM family methyltransferase
LCPPLNRLPKLAGNMHRKAYGYARLNRAPTEAYVQQTQQRNSSSRFSDAKSAARDKHERALALYAGGQFEASAKLLREALMEAPSSEFANDCGAAELACGRREQALAGFFLAASLDPKNIEAIANLGTLLAQMDRIREAIPHLQQAMHEIKDADQRAALGKLLARCGKELAERVLAESRNAQQTAAAPASRQAVAPQPAVAPMLRPPVYMGNNIALLCTTNHNKMYVDTRDLLIAPWLLIHGEWEPEETELVKKLIKPGDVFVDVGANLGYYSLIAARVGASRVYAFEAQPSTYELLGKNVIINWMTKFITYEHLAVYSHTAELDFFVRNNYPGNSSVGTTPPDQLQKWFDTTTPVKVHAVSLDDYFADKPGKLDVIKVDVEGAEPAVFEGARRTLVRNRDVKILCEWSPDQMATARQDPAHLVDLWAEQGFRAHVLHTGLNEVPLRSLLTSGYQNLLLYR